MDIDSLLIEIEKAESGSKMSHEMQEFLKLNPFKREIGTLATINMVKEDLLKYKELIKTTNTQ